DTGNDTDTNNDTGNDTDTNTNNDKDTNTSDDDKAKLGNLIVTVYEYGTGKIVPGATVEITDTAGETKEYVSDTNGKITITDTEPGEYKIVTTKVPKGYNVVLGKVEKATVKAGDTATHDVYIETGSTSSTDTVDKTPNSTTPVTSTNTTDKSVQTGDDFNAKTPIALLFISLMGIAALIYGKKKYDIF
ncbi:MAG: hypothetical protein IJ224_10720, partial [Lachnospiraceae bacterium]|nr:hypothetical protein [Lachnospiraceae bacterium]